MNKSAVYKPGSVYTAIYLDLLLPAGSSEILRARRAISNALSFLAPDGVYSHSKLPKNGVSSYLAFPPLLAASFISKRERRNGKRYISVALSLGSPPPGVTRHPALWSPDFPHSKLRGRSAASSEGKYNTCSTSRQLEDRVI